MRVFSTIRVRRQCAGGSPRCGWAMVCAQRRTASGQRLLFAVPPPSSGAPPLGTAAPLGSGALAPTTAIGGGFRIYSERNCCPLSAALGVVLPVVSCAGSNERSSCSKARGVWERPLGTGRGSCNPHKRGWWSLQSGCVESTQTLSETLPQLWQYTGAVRLWDFQLTPCVSGLGQGCMLW